MTTDRRLDLIERILILYFNSGRRERRRVREMDEKINILINARIENANAFRELREQSKRTDRQIQETNREMREGFRELRDLFWKTDERIDRLDEAQKRTDRKLNELSDRS